MFGSKKTPKRYSLPMTLHSKGERNGLLLDTKFLQDILPRIPKEVLGENVSYHLEFDIKLTIKEESPKESPNLERIEGIKPEIRLK